jgi:putative ABC transport system permease protein
MLQNYFKIAWRNIVKTKGYSALNISGLAAGMSVALLIGLWVNYQFTYDKFLPDNDRLYQVRRNYVSSNGEVLNFTSTSLKLADALRNQIPEIENVSECDWSRSGLKVGEKKLLSGGMHMNSNFLQMFRFPMVQGNPNTALKDPYSIVLTEATAKSLFGNENPIGKYVRFDNKDNLKVTALLKDIPGNSSFQFSWIVPFAYFEQTNSYIKDQRAGGFGNNSYNIYVQLKKGITYSQVAPKIKFIERTEKNNQNAMLSEVIFQPMANWHLYGNYENRVETGGFVEYVRMFSIIGALVLLIACINFINLATARSEKRAREVGVRKALGSLRKDLIFQFLTESFLLTSIAFFIALVLVTLLLPGFNQLTESLIVIPYSSPVFWIWMLIGVSATALIAGSRPAFYLSGFNPVKVLKGKMHVGRTATLPRKILVVVQFSCSIALIICTIIIYQQIQYAKDRPTGYDKDRLLMSDLNGDLENNYGAIKSELINSGIVESMTTATSEVTDVGWHTGLDWPGKKPGETLEMGAIEISMDYFKTLGIKFKEGRDFSNENDTMSVIFNESAINKMRLKNPVSQIITFDTTRKIIGVVKDALMLSPFSPADPTMFMLVKHPRWALIYRLNNKIPTQDAITKLTAVFNRFNPEYPFKYSFVDERYAQKFNLEMLVGKLSGIFAGLAIFISCLGLLGLAAYVAEQRNKEIGVRKVLGSSITQIWILLSKDFILLVFISCLIATPLAFYFLQNWLSKYSYRIQIGPGVFILASAIALVVTLVTISFQSVKAAIANPVDSLRSE